MDRLTRPNNQMDRGPRMPHLSASARGRSGETQQIWEDAYRDYALLEAGGLFNTFIEGTDVASQLSSLAPVTATFKGRALIPFGWTKSTVVSSDVAADTSLRWTMVAPGLRGDAYSVQFRRSANPATTVTVVGTTILVLLAAAGDTPANIVAVVMPAAPARYAVTAAVYPPGAPGAGLIVGPPPPATMFFRFAGGEGEALKRCVYQTALGVADAEARYVARKAGEDGTGIRIRYLHVGAGAATVGVVGKDITVTIDTGVTLLSEVLAVLRASTPAMRLISANLAVGHGGGGAVAAMGWQTLVDDDYFARGSAFAGGVPAVGFTATSDDALVIDFPTVTSVGTVPGTAPWATGDLVPVEIYFCGVRHNLSMVLL